MSIERVTVPAAVQASGFNRDGVVPLEEDGYYAVGHLLLRAE
jgi:hypothetical protein